MQREESRLIMGYYVQIPDMMRMLKEEYFDLEQQYDGLGAADSEGMPSGNLPGKPVENMAINVIENGVWGRLREIETSLAVLEEDLVAIRGCLDRVAGRYKKMLLMRYQRKYSWGKIAVTMETPDSTVRHWHDKALDALGLALNDVLMSEEILGRASRARV